MAIRATEFVVIAKVQNQASMQLRRIAGDFRRISSAQELAAARDAASARTMRARMGVWATEGRMRESAIAQTQRLRQLEEDMYRTRTQRMRALRRVETLKDPIAQGLAQRDARAATMRLGVLETRRSHIAERHTNQLRQQNAELSLQKRQLQAIMAEEAALTKQIQLQQTARRTAATGMMLSHFGRAATFGGMIATGGLALAGAQAANFDQLSVKAASQITSLNANAQAMLATSARLREDLKDLMMQFPATQEQMADSAYQTFSSLSVSYNQGIDLIRRFNEVAAASGSTLETATSLGITAINNFDPKMQNTGAILNTVFAIIRDGRMELEDFNDMMNKLAPAAAAADQSLLDIAGGMAQITRLMPSQAMASTSMARLMQVFTRKDFQKGMADFGQKITDNNGRLLSFVDVIGKIIKLDPSMQQGGARLQHLIQTVTAKGRGGTSKGIESTEMSRRALVFFVTHYEELVNLQGRAVRNQKQFQKQLEAMRASPGFRWQVMINQFRLLALEIGTAALPVLLRFGDWVQGMIEKWRGLSKHTRDLIVQIGAWAAIFMLVVGPIATVLGSVISLIAQIVKFTKWLGLTGIGVKTLATRVAALVAVTVALGGAEGTAALMLRGLGYAAEFALLKLLPLIVATEVLMSLLRSTERERFMDSAGRGELGTAVMDFALPGNPGTDLANWWDSLDLPGFLKNKKEMTFDRLWDQAGLDKGSFRKTHDEWLKMTVEERTRILDKFGEFNLQDELIHRLSMGSRKEALTPSKQEQAMKKALKFSEEFEKLLGKDAKDQLEALIKMDPNSPFSKFLKEQDTLLDDDAKKLKKWRDEMKAWNKERADTIKNAIKQAEDLLDQAAQNLVNKFNELKQANQSAMATLFQGPWLTGEQFTEAKEWGVKPEMIDIIKDTKMSTNAFIKWRSTLASLRKRGLPTELMDELQALGPAAIDQLEVIKNASPAQVKEWVAQWKRGKQAIEKATQADFNRQLAAWKKHGKDAAWQLINGMAASFADIKLKEKFDNLIRGLFSNKVITETINAELAAWLENNPKPTLEAGGGTTTGATTGAGKGGGSKVWPGAISAKEYEENMYAHGWVPWNPNLVRKVRVGRNNPPVAHDAGSRTAASVNNTKNYNTHIHIHPLPGESPDAAARRAAFHFKRKMG